MAEDYDECRECGAMVDRMNRHRTWHSNQDQVLRKYEAAIRRLEHEVRALRR